jgi:TonB-linked SusC/RagA family outer membrane protein
MYLLVRGTAVQKQKRRMPRKLLLIMKLATFLIFVASLHVSAGSSAQEVSLSGKHISLDKIFAQIKLQTGYVFIYNDQDMEKAIPVSLFLKGVSLTEALETVLKDQPLTYEIQGRTILIKVKPVLSPAVRPSESTYAPLTDIHGRVVDENRQAIVGATVRLKDGSQITSTDVNGNFYLKNIRDNAVVVFSFVGYTTQELPVSRDMGTISMEVSNSNLNEVVVIGYGTAKRKDLTGAVSSVTADEIEKQAVQNPLNALQGHIAGAMVTTDNGLPGSRVNILIRGQNTLSNGTVPLYIIDGIPFNISNGSNPPTNDVDGEISNGANGGVSPFSFINPADIERIDVLKDADATAIYGTRGANGVVLITTKKGQAGPTKVDLNFYEGIGKVPRWLDMLNTQQYLDLRRQAYQNDGITPTASSAPDLFTWSQTANTDWQRKFLGGTNHLTDAQANISGGNALTHFLFGTSYHRETTVYPGDYADQRLTAHFNLDHSSANKKFNANLTASYAYDQSNLPITDLASVYNLPPNYPLYNPDGTLYWDGNFTNPESYLLQKYQQKTNNLLSNLKLGYSIIDGLRVQANFSYFNISSAVNTQTPIASQNPIFYPGATNDATFGNTGQSTWVVEPQLTYDRKISKGKLSALLGTEFQRSQNQSTSLNASNYSNPGLMYLPTGAASYSSSAKYVLYKYNSVFGRITYNWSDKYLANVNIRTDGSSRFGPDHRFGTFYSLGGAWVFSKEKFLQSWNNVLSFGKLRASFGTTGNDQFSDYAYLANYTSSAGSAIYQGSSVVYSTSLANPDLHWEINRKLDLGLELGFLKDRLHLTGSVYRNRSSDQLTDVSLPIFVGINSYNGNLPALIQNEGVELELNTANINGKYFQWKTNVNWTFARNQLLKIDPSYFFASQVIVGYPVNQDRRYEFLNLNPQTGTPVYYSATAGTTATPVAATDRPLAFNPNPTAFGGIGNDFTYKNWSLSFFFQFVKQTGNIYPTTQPGILANGNFTTYVLNRWQNPGDVTNIPKASTQYSLYSSYYAYSNAVYGNDSYIRFQNATLGYNFSNILIRHLHFSSLRVFMQGQNLYTWAKNKTVFDPTSLTFTGGAGYPSLRIITMGLNCSF